MKRYSGSLWVLYSRTILVLSTALVFAVGVIGNAFAQGTATQAQRFEGQLEAGGIDEFRFDVSQNRVVHLRIVANDPASLTPSVWLYGPSSDLINRPNRDSSISMDCSAAQLARRCKIEEAGTHRLVVTDYYGRGGSYFIELLRLDSSDLPATLEIAPSETGIVRQGSVNMHPFDATPESTMHFRVTSIGEPSTQLAVWLYSPTGRTLFDGNTDESVKIDCGPDSRCRFTEEGRHHLVVTHYQEEDAQYRLSSVDIPIATSDNPTPTAGTNDNQSSQETAEISADSQHIQRQEALQRYQAQFPNGEFFTPQDEDTDGLQYLGGQCIAWAERLYDSAATNPISNYSYGTAANMPRELQTADYSVVRDPKAPKVGALIVWEEPDKYGSGKNGPGHVGVVTGIRQGPLRDGESLEIIVSEANFPESGSPITEESASRWGLTKAEAEREIVTTSYGVFQERVFDTGALSRGGYKFSAYVYP